MDGGRWTLITFYVLRFLGCRPQSTVYRPSLHFDRLGRVPAHSSSDLAGVNHDLAPRQVNCHQVERGGGGACHVLAVAQIYGAMAGTVEYARRALKLLVGPPGNRAPQVLALPVEG